MDQRKVNSIDTLTASFAAQLARDLSTCIHSEPVTLAVAVSGGADSFALLHLAHDWVQNNNARLIAVTVDHHLRAESTAEAKTVAAWCTQHHIPHHILDWQGEKPSSAIQEQARNMRRKFLTEFCKHHACDFLLLGHQADDQAETFFMRLQRGSGITGLGAMQDVLHDTQNDISIVRPLLFARRQDLRLYCQTHALPFIDDPSNKNDDYERVRMRQSLHAFPDMTKGVMLTTARLQRADNALQQIAAQWVDTHMHVLDHNIFWIPSAPFANLPDEIRLRVLMHLITAITHNPRPPLSDVEEWDTQLAQAGFSGSNIAGCWARPKTIDKIQGLAFQVEPVRKQP